LSVTRNLIQELHSFGYRADITAALAWPKPTYGSLLRRHSTSSSVVHCTTNHSDYEACPELDDAGTYSYHSHVDFQAISASGPLIMKNCDATPYSCDETLSFSSAAPTTRLMPKSRLGCLPTRLYGVVRRTRCSWTARAEEQVLKTRPMLLACHISW
jgi:hypothetical protein